MTTIAYRDGVLCSDSRAYGGDAVPIGLKSHKIQRLADGSLFGISSTIPGLSEALFTYFRDWADYRVLSARAEPGLVPAQKPEIFDWKGELDFTALWISPAGEVYMYVSSLAPLGPLQADFYAIGSGERYALGAMAMGATARTAVQVSIGLDVWSALPVQELVLVENTQTA